MAKKSIEDVNLSGKRVVVRVDYNVPLEEREGQMVITDDTRIVETLPTLKHLSAQGARTVLVAHLGRPKGKADPKQSLAPVAGRPIAPMGPPADRPPEPAGFQQVLFLPSGASGSMS